MLTPTENWEKYHYGDKNVKLGGKGGKRNQKTHLVHVLVAAAFIGPKPKGMEVAHNNGNAGENRLENIRYATPLENTADKKIHGTHLFGEMAPNAKLSETQVVEICGLPQELGIIEIGRRFGISIAQVSRIRNRKQWSHLEGRADG